MRIKVKVFTRGFPELKCRYCGSEMICIMDWLENEVYYICPSCGYKDVFMKKEWKEVTRALSKS